ncbi:hypothetical protein ACJX0J_032334, partial [Zea mays]
YISKKDYLIEKDVIYFIIQIVPTLPLLQVNPALPDTNSPIVIIFHALGILESSWQGEEYSLLQIHESFDFMVEFEMHFYVFTC